MQIYCRTIGPSALQRLETFCQGRSLDAAYLCGPEAMIMSCKDALVEAGMAEEMKFELLRQRELQSPRQKLWRPPAPIPCPCKWCWMG